MNTKYSLAFLGALSSKICLDVVAPVSAIDMGLSILDDHLPDNLRLDPAYGLLRDSLDKTLRRINFFRYAFAFGKDDPIPSEHEFAEHCKNACEHYKVKFVLDEFSPPQSNLYLRMIACLMYLLIDTLPKGGKINLSVSESITSFDLSGPLVIMNASVEKITQKSRESFRTQTILPELVLMGLGELNLNLETHHTPTTLKALLR
jgi:hypothetical protein